jgi:hypothetical protein
MRYLSLGEVVGLHRRIIDRSGEERLMLGVADGSVSRETLSAWIRSHSRTRT